MWTYPAAAIPEQYVVLGQTLKPFCLGHYILLQRLDCGFVVESEKGPMLEDLLVGVMVCCHTYEGAIEYFASGNWVEGCYQWGRSITKSSFWRRLFRKTSEIDFAGKAHLFKRYLEEGMSHPVLYFEQSGKGITAPWEEALFYGLKTFYRYTDSEIYNMPLSLAIARNCARMEIDGGGVRFQTDNDRELIRMANQLQEDKRNGN